MPHITVNQSNMDLSCQENLSLPAVDFLKPLNISEWMVHGQAGLMAGLCIHLADTGHMIK